MANSLPIASVFQKVDVVADVDNDEPVDVCEPGLSPTAKHSGVDLGPHPQLHVRGDLHLNIIGDAFTRKPKRTPSRDTSTPRQGCITSVALHSHKEHSLPKSC